MTHKILNIGISLALSCLLLACGGEGESPTTNTTPAMSGFFSGERQEITVKTDVQASAAPLNKMQLDTAKSVAISAEPQITNELLVANHSAFGAGATVGAVNTAIPAPIAACQQIDLGLVYSDSTPPSGSLKCYQFVVSNNAKIDSQVLLPAGVNAVGMLFIVDPATGKLSSAALDTDNSPNNPLFLQSMSQAARLVLVIQATSGTGGQALKFAAWARAGFDSYEPNDKVLKPTVAKVNQALSANIDVAGVDQDYFFFPLKNAQTAADITINFTADQSAGIRIAKKTSDMQYAFAPETALQTSQSGKRLTINGIPVSKSGEQYGVFLRVSGVNPSAAPAQPYSILVNTNDVYIADFNANNSENITRWYPQFAGYGLQAANYIDLSVTVKDSSGQLVEGQMVAFGVSQNKERGADSLLMTGVRTNQFGQAFVHNVFNTCEGKTVEQFNYGPFSNTAPRWNGEAQVGLYAIQLTNASPPKSEPNGDKIKPIIFYRICKETVVRSK
jgi:hypothetical protein